MLWRLNILDSFRKENELCMEIVEGISKFNKNRIELHCFEDYPEKD